jgi:hypothetical protein
MHDFPDIDAWAEAYIRVHDANASLDRDHPDYLAAYEFMADVSGPRSEECWLGILAVVKRRPSQRVLGMLAAGLVEDLLDEAGIQFIARIESEAQRDPVFKGMLDGVWESGAPEVWVRFEAARQETTLLPNKSPERTHEG